MSDEKNSSPNQENPDLTAKQTGESSTLPVESGAQKENKEEQSNGQSSEAPVTG